MLSRAYCVLTVKSVDDEQRIVEGLASTVETDRQGDVMVPAGAKFSLPMPLLWQHRADEPIGHVLAAEVTKSGIKIKAKIAKGVLPRIDEAWALIRSGLVQGLSIGFKPLADPEPIKGSFGFKFSSWEWLELSAVTIPANASASISLIKSVDAEHLAASGAGAEAPVPPAGVSASPTLAVARKGARTMAVAKTIGEQISSWEATMLAKDTSMNEIMEKANETGTVLDDAQKEEYDTLAGEVKNIGEHIQRLRDREEANKKAAVPVNGSTPKAASDSRGGAITVKSNLPPGTGFTRYAMALATARGSRFEAAEYAKRWEKDTPEVAMVLKAAVTAGTTTDSDWAAPLVVYQNMAGEFVELLRPQTILGKIPGIRRVPFNVTMPTQTQGSTANWVGQTKPKPVSELKFGQLSLGMFKAAGIVVLSEELVRSSSPSAEAIVRQDLIATIAQFLDEQFIDPSNAGSANVSPAAITNGITAVDSTGTTAAAFRTDVKTLLATFTAANLSLAGSVWVMTETQALAFSMIQNALGQPEYPGITAQGGTLMGLPVVTSESVNAEGGSPAGNRIVLIKAGEILLADDGGVNVDVSREASVQMDSAPDDPATASTVMVSLWQNNLVGLRAERFINWTRRRAEAVGIIEGAIYVG